MGLSQMFSIRDRPFDYPLIVEWENIGIKDISGSHREVKESPSDAIRSLSLSTSLAYFVRPQSKSKERSRASAISTAEERLGSRPVLLLLYRSELTPVSFFNWLRDQFF